MILFVGWNVSLHSAHIGDNNWCHVEIAGAEAGYYRPEVIFKMKLDVDKRRSIY